MTPSDKRRILIEYLRMKADEGDWHGVCDAANDLRELEAAGKSDDVRKVFSANTTLSCVECYGKWIDIEDRYAHSANCTRAVSSRSVRTS